MRRILTAAVCLLTVLMPQAHEGFAQEELPAVEMVPDEITPETQRVIERGLAHLASTQAEEGSWPLYERAGNTGITGLAGLAFMAGGTVPGRGKYGANVDRAVEYVVKNTRRDGFITSGNSRMYEHGFATLFLAEVYGMTGEAEVKKKLRLAIDLIERTQNQEGGWRYNPVPFDADISVTICQIMALRAARNAGIQVSKRVIDNGIKYVKKCQQPDGGFSYTAYSGGSGFARTAAGVCSLYYAGVYEDKAIQRGLDWLYGGINREMQTGASGHFHYGHYYGVQAMFQAGGKYWKGYYPVIRDKLASMQRPDGSFTGFGGTAYATAMSCIILQVPYRYLPVLQR